MSRSLRTILNESNANKADTALKLARAGDFLARVPRTLIAAVVGHKVVLPDNAKCEQVLSAFVTAGTVTGRFNPTYVTPATTKDVAPNGAGDIVFLAADAVTAVELTYLAFEGEIVEETGPVAAGVFTPSGSRKAMCVLSATGLAGSVIGAKTPVLRAAAPATTQVAVSLTGNIAFNSGTDALTSATVKYVATPGVGVSQPALGVNLDAVTQGF